jgi:hypothetical protein
MEPLQTLAHLVSFHEDQQHFMKKLHLQKKPTLQVTIREFLFKSKVRNFQHLEIILVLSNIKVL